MRILPASLSVAVMALALSATPSSSDRRVGSIFPVAVHMALCALAVGIAGLVPRAVAGKSPFSRASSQVKGAGDEP